MASPEHSAFARAVHENKLRGAADLGGVRINTMRGNVFVYRPSHANEKIGVRFVGQQHETIAVLSDGENVLAWFPAANIESVEMLTNWSTCGVEN